MLASSTSVALALVPRLRSHHAAATNATADTAATVDHRRLGTHAPNNRSPAPVLVHGPTVEARARTAPTRAILDPAAGVGSGGTVRSGSPSSDERHSGPIVRPRTGTAQARQIGSSHAPQRATAPRPG